MRTPGSYGGFYASLNRYYESKHRSEDYRFQQARAFAQSRASRFFRLCRDRWEGMGNRGKGICDDVVCLIMDGTKLTSSESSFTDAVKITAIWVEHAHRGQGHGRNVLSELTKMSDQSGCVLIAVSNPIDYPEDFSAKDVLKDSEKGEWETSMKYVKYGYRKRQARMNRILETCGFRNIDMADWFQNPKRCRVQDSWAYVPDNYARHLDWDERGLADRLKK